MKDTILISAFPGTGKTYFYNSTALDVLDSDSSTFDKKDFPANYIKHIKENIGEVDMILISSHENVRYELEQSGLGYNLVYPAKELKDEYIQRYKERGNEDTFVKLLEDNWDEWQDVIELESGCRHIVLQSGEYLADRIDECEMYSPISWTIKTKNYRNSGLIKAETEEEACKLFLKEYDEYTDEDIIYCRPSGRYSYSTTGYGIFSLHGFFYASGRIEVYDRENDSGYAADEGTYWVPLKDEGKFRDFFDDLETDMPIKISLGHMNQIDKAVADEVGVPVDKLDDEDVRKEFMEKKHQEYLDRLDKLDREYLEEKYGEIK